MSLNFLSLEENLWVLEDFLSLVRRNFERKCLHMLSLLILFSSIKSYYIYSLDQEKPLFVDFPILTPYFVHAFILQHTLLNEI